MRISALCYNIIFFLPRHLLAFDKNEVNFTYTAQDTIPSITNNYGPLIDY